MDKKVLYALTTKIFNTLKKLGIKPKIGVTTDIQRLPGANSFNTDFSTLTQARPESLKKIITVDADFLAKANPDELRQYYNNLEYVQATYPDVFSKPQVVTEAKTGIKTLVDDLNEKLKGKKSMETVNPKTGEVTSPKEPITVAENKSRQLTKDEIADYEEAIGRNSEEWLSEGTVKEAEEALKRSKAEEAYYRGQYKTGKLDPAPGENTRQRMRFLKEKLAESEITGDKRLITLDEMDELANLESKFAYKQGDIITEENFADTPFAPSASSLKALELARKQSKKLSEAEMIKEKYGSIIDDNLLKQILIDDDPQRKAEVLASIDEAIKMQEKGIPYEEIINIMKNTTRTKQADGGLTVGIGTMFKKKGR